MYDDVDGEESATPKSRAPVSVRKFTANSNDSSENTEGEGEENQTRPDGNRFVDLSILQKIFGMLFCPECKRGTVAITELFKMGFASEMKVCCENECASV